MAHVLYYPDGTKDVVIGSSREELHDELHNIIEDRLGYEAAELFNEVSIDGYGVEKPEGEDWESISDDYLQMLNSAVDELDAIIKEFKKPRINRQRIESSIMNLRNSINSNI